MYKYQSEIVQMVYVFGEVRDPLPVVTKLIEDMVRHHLMEIVSLANEASRQRSSRNIGIEDIIFVIKHDKTKVARIKTYLSYKDVRKNAKDEDEVAEGIEEEDGDELKSKVNVRLPWEYIEGFTDVLEDEEVEDQNDKIATFEDNQRLKEADIKTRDMTAQEYMFYSECRSASFSHRKGKRFRTWINMGSLTDVKPNDDVVDILGFLGYEMVRRITEFALVIKKESEKEMVLETRSKRELEDLEIFSLFSCTKLNTQQTPLEERHILEAYLQLQHPVYPHPYKQARTRILLA
eukprot:NODE_69_length_23719_cov_0.556689.p7 type:complete len:292 gc:universal NODE_69_length_23719_cov_0.556689:15863-14988(-)